MNHRIRKRVSEAVDALDAAAEARARGDLGQAVRWYEEAEERLRRLIADDPGEGAHLHALGSALYDAGEVRLQRGDLDGAEDTLRRAEAAYQELAGIPGAPAGVGLWIADVRVRRARALAQQGRRASALAEAQAGLLAYRERWSTEPQDPLSLEVARVLAWQAYVTVWSGDPDVAVGAADTALRLYLARAGEVNADPGLRAVHLPTFLLAAHLAALVHGAFGRGDLARQAADLAASADPTRVLVAAVLPGREQVAGELTLAGALDRAGGSGLRETLTAPAVDCRILMPLDRAAPQLAPAYAAELARLADDVLDRDPAAGLRLAMEAHGMFAGASELQVPAMRYQFGDWGPAWASVLRRASQTAWAAGGRELARDLVDWMVGAVGMLGPFLVIDADARRTARACITWQAEVYEADGDREAAAKARDSLRMLDDLDRG